MMKKKSNMWLKIIIGIGLIVTALFATLFLIRGYQTVTQNPFSESYDELNITIPATATVEERLIVETLRDNENDYSVAQKLHESDKNNKIYLANYIIRCISSKKINIEVKWDDDYKIIMNDPKLKADFFAKNKKMLELLNYAEKIDPDNALYNYLQALTFFSEAAVIEYSENKKTKYCQGKIIDKKKLAQALNQYQKGLAKPYYHTYATDLMKQRVEILMPNPTDYCDYIQKIGIEATTPLTSLGLMRELARQIKTAIIYQQKQGNYQECENLIKTGNLFIQQHLNDSNFFIEYLVARAIGKIYYETASEYYKARRNSQLTAYYDEKLVIINQNILDKGTCKIPPKKLGLIDDMMFSNLPIFEKQAEINDKLSPHIIVTYKFAEQMIVCLVVLELVLIVVVQFIMNLFKNKNPYLKLTNKELLLIVGFGLIMPLVVYLPLTNIDLLSGREFSLIHNPQVIPQFMLLVMNFVLPVNIVIMHIVRKHCLKENIAVPSEKMSLLVIVFYLLLIVTAIVATSVVEFYGMDHVFQALIVGAVILEIYAIIYAFKSKKYKLYLKIVQKNMTPYIAVVPIMLGVVLFTVFKYQEYYYIEKDEILFAKAEKGEFMTPLEYKSTQKVKELFRKEVLAK